MMTPLQQHEANQKRADELKRQVDEMHERVAADWHRFLTDWHTPSVVQFEKAKEILRGTK